MPTSQPATQSQSLHIGFAVVLGVALIGFLVGTGRPPLSTGPLAASHGATEDAQTHPTAPTYRALRDAPWRDGAAWATDTAGLRGPSVLDPVDVEGLDKLPALADRSARRAYDGAPPTIPHAVRQDSAAECLACHDEGLRLRGRIASPVSHEAFTSCTQCHVVSQAPMPGAPLPPDAAFGPNGFVGMASPAQGARAWSIAPPVIPHRTLMRERCMSCHGPNGRDALRSSHPDRQSCEQCHAPAADLDMRPGLAALPSTPFGQP
ncbi:nitrate reductase cytochrome c-type subunit [Myxococcota bacterium]|nr:nitrate reductase cytochrome c-type subunit [Myxococcota bacterium]